MNEIWKRIEIWLTRKAPEIGSDLQAGASDADLRAVASKFGVNLPADMLASYRLHDGTRGSAAPLLGDWRLLSLSAVVQAWTMLKESAKEGDFEDSEGESAPEIKDEWWNARWVPVASNGSGDFLCIDLDPARGGKRGQVISYYHAEPRRELVATSFEHWLDGFANDLEAGRYQVEDGWLTKVG